MGNFMLETKDLTKRFGKFTALDKVNLQVKEGEVFGFIGPNGAGKTTTIRCLLGILQATEGSASVFGLDAWKDAVEIHKRIAYVPGDVNLWANLTGGEVIDLFVSLRQKSDKEKREKLIKKFELDPSKKCRTYSKGNRQKVALVAAFASDADLYILDEPTSGLDPLMEQVFQECVGEKKKEGKSIFLSSHILLEVEKLCDRVGIIREGSVAQTGTLDELRFLTRINMNIETREAITGLEAVSGVSGIEKTVKGIAFQVENEQIPEVVTFISKFGVTRLESKPPALEELFMKHYSNENVSTTSATGGE
ncbi:MAG: ABC transporter ATP-binding protein [Oscillospiraceae bacterium]|nr:ABC transporter ATP-binding protein [Oscillospiraceae bacterium]